MVETLQYEVTQQLEIAEKNGKRFVNKEERFNSKSELRSSRINSVGGLGSFWIIMSFLGIPLAIVFGIYEAFTAQTAILSLVDPLDIGLVNPALVQLLGAGLAVFEMFMGHIFAESLQREKHQVTGRYKRSLGVPFFLSLAGILGSIFFQYKLVMTISEGGADFNNFAIVAIGVVCFEILVGVLIVGKAYSYLLIFVNAIELWFLRRGMNKASEATKNSYRDYKLLLDNWNLANPILEMQRERNSNIKRAIMHFDGSKP